MTRISESQAQRSLIENTMSKKRQVAKYSNELTSGYKVVNPSDSEVSGTIARYRESLSKIESYSTSITQTKSHLQFQDDVMSQVGDLIIRTQEVAAQAANETNSSTARAQLSAEIYQIRDHIVSLANSQYQGRYIFHGATDDTPPYILGTPYTAPASGHETDHYVFDNQLGSTLTRSVSVTDSLTVQVNSAGNTLFDTTIANLEKLARSLSGYTTGGGDAAYNLPAEFTRQTTEIKQAMDALSQQREQVIIPERTDLGGRLRRLETGESLLSLAKNTAEEVLDRLQNTDETESASSLSQAQTALEASYTVTARVLRLSILDYI